MGDKRRMRGLILFGVLVSLTACDPGADAKERYAMASEAGNNDDMCSAARDAADAYLKADRQAQYEDWSVKARLICAAA